MESNRLEKKIINEVIRIPKKTSHSSNVEIVTLYYLPENNSSDQSFEGESIVVGVALVMFRRASVPPRSVKEEERLGGDVGEGWGC